MLNIFPPPRRPRPRSRELLNERWCGIPVKHRSRRRRDSDRPPYSKGYIMAPLSLAERLAQDALQLTISTAPTDTNGGKVEAKTVKVESPSTAPIKFTSRAVAPVPGPRPVTNTSSAITVSHLSSVSVTAATRAAPPMLPPRQKSTLDATPSPAILKGPSVPSSASIPVQSVRSYPTLPPRPLVISKSTAPPPIKSSTCPLSLVGSVASTSAQLTARPQPPLPYRSKRTLPPAASLSLDSTPSSSFPPPRPAAKPSLLQTSGQRVLRGAGEDRDQGHSNRPIDPRARKRYRVLFDQLWNEQQRATIEIEEQEKRLNSETVKEVWVKSRLSQSDLKEIW